jgi:hypothetical protein
MYLRRIVRRKSMWLDARARFVGSSSPHLPSSNSMSSLILILQLQQPWPTCRLVTLLPWADAAGWNARGAVTPRDQSA